MGQKLINLIGQTYGQLKVIEFDKMEVATGDRKYARWVCQCNCGTIKSIRGDKLKSKHQPTRSCGCLQRKIFAENTKSKKKPFGMNSAKGIYNGYRLSAKSRSYDFEITFEEALKLFQANCFYCNLEPKNYYMGKQANGGFYYNGIDRVDNKIGYVLTNCVSCCKMCNRGKRDHNISEFLDWIKRVYEYSNGT